MAWRKPGIEGRLSRDLGIADRLFMGENLGGCGGISALA